MIKPEYSVTEIRDIRAFLETGGTLNFPALPNGLFPAATLSREKSYTGYSYVWVRDNVHIAHALFRVGRIQAAVKNLRSLMKYFIKYRKRFDDIIQGRVDPNIPMNRPQIRFNGRSLTEIKEKWPHAQNDALGYFLWMFCKLVYECALNPSTNELNMLTLFPRYFEAIQYWQDEDSGHWEEARKISASSIGVVLAGLTEFRKLADSGPFRTSVGTHAVRDIVDRLIQRGRRALRQILPWECIQPNPSKRRRYDAALLFLVYPLQIVKAEMADRILQDVKNHLQGRIGVRRYRGDSYWAPDYKKKLKPADRAAEVSDDMSKRNRLLPRRGEEAQWCIFDPILSCVFAVKFNKELLTGFRRKEIEYLNRSLAQITAAGLASVPALRCPELYYLANGEYVPNDHVPLLWTQANLMLALKLIEKDLS